MRRKNVVVGFFDTIQNDVDREIDRSVHTEVFQKRFKVDRNTGNKKRKDDFIASIKSESASRAEVYKAKPGPWFTSNAHLGKAVIDGLALSTLAKAKYELWLRDKTLSLMDMGMQCLSDYHSYQRSYCKLLALQRQELTEAEEAETREVEGSDGKAAKRLQTLALADCISRRFLAGEDELDLADETTSLTPLWQHLFLGDFKVAERLLQARASPEHVPSQDEEEGKTPLLWASKEGYADAALLLLKYKANTEATTKVSNLPTFFFTVTNWNYELKISLSLSLSIYICITYISIYIHTYIGKDIILFLFSLRHNTRYIYIFFVYISITDTHTHMRHTHTHTRAHTFVTLPSSLHHLLIPIPEEKNRHS
jgi:hypothetical protein